MVNQCKYAGDPGRTSSIRSSVPLIDFVSIHHPDLWRKTLASKRCHENTMAPEEPEGKDRRTIVAEEEVVVVAVAVEEVDFTLQQNQISLYRCVRSFHAITLPLSKL